jgi:hypothetical protein
VVWKVMDRMGSQQHVDGATSAETRVDMAMAMAGHKDAGPEQQQRQPRRALNVSASRRRRGGGGGLELNDRATLLLVATLITTLSYQVGSNVPGGYWQDNDESPPHRHRAGDPILRDEHYGLYVLFVWSSWIGFGSSMVLTMGLLTGVATGSRFVRWLFVVAYSTLVLTFITSQSHTFVWINVLVWVAVMAALAFAVTYRRLSDLIEWLCGDNDTHHHQVQVAAITHDQAE